MGKAARWLKGLFGIKSTTNNQSHRHSNSSAADCERTRSSFGRDRMVGCYGGICNNPETIPPNISPSEAEWIKNNYYNNNSGAAHNNNNNNNNKRRSSGEYYSTSSKEEAMEENKHAIAVAAATAAAADAAVAAAQAAVAVVRLTGHGRTTTNRFATSTSSHKYYWDAAAVKIQATFRGYLARKALRALRALVKLQALVRGYLVRKQATATFHGMQALIRAQSTIRSKRLQLKMMSSTPSNIQRQKDCYFPPPPATTRPSRRSMDIYDDTRSSTLSIPNSSSSRRLSLSAASFDTKNIINPPPIPDSEYYDIPVPPKVVQIDLGRPNSRSRRSTTTSYSELGEDPSSYQSLHYYYPHPPPRLSIPPTCHHHCSHQVDDDYMRPFSATAQTTPRFMGTPSKTSSVCSDINNSNHHLGPYYYYPNYMASTKSFKAKSRSQSLPKQRPTADILSSSSKKRLSAGDYELDSSSTNGFYGVRMQRSSSHITTNNNNNREASLNFSNAVSYR